MRRIEIEPFPADHALYHIKTSIALTIIHKIHSSIALRTVSIIAAIDRMFVAESQKGLAPPRKWRAAHNGIIPAIHEMVSIRRFLFESFVRFIPSSQSVEVFLSHAASPGNIIAK